MMELRHLRYFTSVADNLNISRASEQLHVSQPALSRQIKDLEEELGARLFTRHASGMRLTNVGRTFLHKASDILTRADTAVREVSLNLVPPPNLNVGFHATVVTAAFFQCLQIFGPNHPEIDLTLVENEPSELLRELISGSLDICLFPSGSESLSPAFERLVVSKQRLLAIVSAEHELASRGRIGLEELSEERLVICDALNDSSWTRAAFDACRAAGFDPPAILTTPSHGCMFGQIAAQRGYSLQPRSVWRYGQNRSICALELSDAPVFVTTTLAWRRSDVSGIRDQFIREVIISHQAIADRESIPNFLPPLIGVPLETKLPTL